MGTRVSSGRAAIVWPLLIVGALLAGVVAFSRPGRNSPSKELAPAGAESQRRALNLRGFNALVLLRDERVVRELGISDDPNEALRLLADEFLAEVKRIVEFGKSLQSGAENEKAVQWKAMDNARRQAIDDFSMRAAEVLTDDQRFRLSQITFQLRGEDVFYNDDVVGELKLSAEQRTTIAAARNDLRAHAQQLNAELAARRLSRAQHQERITALRREQLRNYQQMLSGGQIDAYDALRGESIPFTKEDIIWELRPSSTHPVRSAMSADD